MEQPFNAVIAIPTRPGSEPIRATLDPESALWTCPDPAIESWLNLSKPYPPQREPGTYDPDPLYTVALAAAEMLGGTVEYIYEQPDIPKAVY